MVYQSNLKIKKKWDNRSKSNNKKKETILHMLVYVSTCPAISGKWNLIDPMEHILHKRSVLQNNHVLGQHFEWAIPARNCLKLNYLLPDSRSSTVGPESPDKEMPINAWLFLAFCWLSTWTSALCVLFTLAFTPFAACEVLRDSSSTRK